MCGVAVHRIAPQAFGLVLVAATLAFSSACAGLAWADGGAAAGMLRAGDDLAADFPEVVETEATPFLGEFPIPEGAASGTWGADDYAARWYLADDGATLVVGPGVICSSASSDSQTTPDFNGKRSSIKTVRFTQKAFIYPTAANLFEGFTALERIEGASLLSGQHGVLGASQMFAGCQSLKSVNIGIMKFSSNMQHPYLDYGMGITDVTTNCKDAFDGCSSLQTLDLGEGWESGYIGPAVFGPEDVIYDQRATFPVDMTDGKVVYAAGSPIPDGEGHYRKVGYDADIEKLKPKITLKRTSRSVTAKAARQKPHSFSIGASSTSGGAIAYKVVKANRHIVFDQGKVTLKRGLYKKGSSIGVKVKVMSAEKGKYAKGRKTFTLRFKIKK